MSTRSSTVHASRENENFVSWSSDNERPRGARLGGEQYDNSELTRRSNGALCSLGEHDQIRHGSYIRKKAPEIAIRLAFRSLGRRRRNSLDIQRMTHSLSLGVCRRSIRIQLTRTFFLLAMHGAVLRQISSVGNSAATMPSRI